MLSSVLTDKTCKEREVASVQAGLHHDSRVSGSIVIYVVCAPCELHILVGNIGNK